MLCTLRTVLIIISDPLPERLLELLQWLQLLCRVSQPATTSRITLLSLATRRLVSMMYRLTTNHTSMSHHLSRGTGALSNSGNESLNYENIAMFK